LGHKRAKFTLNIATTRGCPYKCNWCAKPIYGNRYNSHSPEYIARHIELLTNLLWRKAFWMCDDIFGLKPNWVQQFNAELKQRKLDIKYYIQSRVDLLLKEDNIDALAESGLEEVWVGAESALAENPRRHGQRHQGRTDLRSHTAAQAKTSASRSFCNSAIWMKTRKTSTKPYRWSRS
jgi:radical SAM superfamily enzyme YgiQ (UPF0313 family)